MVVAQHIGRLGNNLFQIAAAIGYARKYGYKWAADSGMGLSEPYSSIHKVFPNLPKDYPNGKRYNEHPHAWCHIHNCHFDICHFDFHPLRDRGADVTLFGFYQSLEYFKDCQEEVKEVFKLDYYPEYQEFTSVHVRRGDYVQHPGSFPPVTEEYLYRAMSILFLRGCKKFLFFSDDVEWVNSFINVGFVGIERFNDGSTVTTRDIECIVFDQADERKSLSAMASCSNHIIANSSFSWWGGYLGHNPDKVIVTPAQSGFNWFGPTGGVKNPKTLIPDGWIQIAFR